MYAPARSWFKHSFQTISVRSTFVLLIIVPIFFFRTCSMCLFFFCVLDYSVCSCVRTIVRQERHPALDSYGSLWLPSQQTFHLQYSIAWIWRRCSIWNVKSVKALHLLSDSKDFVNFDVEYLVSTTMSEIRPFFW